MESVKLTDAMWSKLGWARGIIDRQRTNPYRPMRHYLT